MLATLVNEPFDDKKWVFETKWDGFRLISEKRGSVVRLWSRNSIDVTSKYAVLLPALQKVDGSYVIDGEICALDAQGRSRFQLLQNALNKTFDFGGLRSSTRPVPASPTTCERRPRCMSPSARAGAKALIDPQSESPIKGT